MAESPEPLGKGAEAVGEIGAPADIADAGVDVAETFCGAGAVAGEAAFVDAVTVGVEAIGGAESVAEPGTVGAVVADAELDEPSVADPPATEAVDGTVDAVDPADEAPDAATAPPDAADIGVVPPATFSKLFLFFAIFV